MTDDDIRVLIQSVWETTLGIPLTEPQAPTFASGTRATAACVQISGAWSGAVLLQCPERAARDAAAAMFMTEPAKVTVSEMQESVAELCNMVAGNLKALLPEPSYISLPSVVEGGDFSSRVLGAQVAHRVSMSANGQDVCVTVLTSVRQGAGFDPGVKVA